MSDLCALGSATVATPRQVARTQPTRQFFEQNSPLVVELPDSRGLAQISEDFPDQLEKMSFLLGARPVGVRTIFRAFAARATAGTPPPSTESFNHAFAALVRAVDAESVEDREIHPAEEMLSEFVRNYGVGGLAREIFFDATKPSRTSSFLRLLGRISAIPLADRRNLVLKGLASPKTAVRDAAIQAVESWHDMALIDLLRDHHDSDQRIAQYAHGVAADLQR